MSGPRRAVVLTMIGLAALTFATPARADDDMPPQVPPVPTDVSESAPATLDDGAIVVGDVPAPASVDPAQTLAPSEELSDDIPVSEAQAIALPVEESPANAPSLPPPSVREQTPHTTPVPLIAAIPRSVPRTTALRARTKKNAAPPRVSHHIARQYQTAGVQYQLVSTAVGAKGRTASAPHSPHAPRTSYPRVPGKRIDASNAMWTDAWNCSEIPDESSPPHVDDDDWKLIQNGSWIPSCTFVPVPGAGVPTDPESDLCEASDPLHSSETATCDPQYQPGGGQYQPVCPSGGPASELQGDEESLEGAALDSTDDAEGAEPCDVGDTEEEVLPSETVASPPSAEPQGSAGAPESAALPPAVGTTQPPRTGAEVQSSTLQPAPASRESPSSRATGRQSRRGRGGSAGGGRGSASGALRTASSTEFTLRSRVGRKRSRPQVRTGQSQPRPRSDADTGAAVGQIVSALAPGTPEQAPRRKVAFSDGPWFILLALALCAVAVVSVLLGGSSAFPDGRLVTGLGSRLRSRGLSRRGVAVEGKRARSRQGNRSRGIRYRE